MRSFTILLISLLSISSQSQKKEYPALLNEILNTRDSLAVKYEQSNTSDKNLIITKARKYLEETIVYQLFPYWYGTPWDFNGTTRIPRKGSIACGYFVTNILTDVGFKIPRVRWAQSPSEIFIKKLSFGHINRFSNKTIEDFEKYLKTMKNGLYIVGLDMHTGFVYIKDDYIRFIHADYYEPEIGVVSEILNSHSPIKDSNYRVLGKLMSKEMLLHWLQQQPIN